MDNNIREYINKKLSLVPHSPGCYLMKNKDNVIIYVGKSKNLKNRLSSYFKASHDGKTGVLVKNICDFEYILTSTELESLLLEINLIKKHNPKYNILLRDDKSYPYIKLSNDKIFRLTVVRDINIKKNSQDKYFGPYPNAGAAKKVVDLINRVYPLKKCKNYEKKVCLYYHIGQCLGYCTNNIDNKVLDNMRTEIISFLNGNSEIITKKLKEEMIDASNKLNFEKALECKEMLEYINVTLERQKVELKDNYNRDIINYYTYDNYMSICTLFIRGGKLLDSNHEIFPTINLEEDIIENYIAKFYERHKVKPHEVIVPNIINTKLLKDALDINFITPIKGDKKKLLDLSYENAKNYLEQELSLTKKHDESVKNALEELKKILNIKSSSRIELFDNSNLFGNFNVSGMVVFQDGYPCKNGYRKYKISRDVNDDYGTMREVIYRRYFRVLKDNLEKPDLIIVDGGEDQLKIAREVLNSLSLNIPSAGLKKDNHHNTNVLVGGEEMQEFLIDKKSPLFLLLTRMQDEVHNYTINYHRNIRSKGNLASILDNIEGIGKVRRNELLKKYRSIEKIKMASDYELLKIIPKNALQNLRKYMEKEYEK